MTPPLDLVSRLPPDAVQLLTANGVQLVHRLGMDVIRSVVLDVLMGRNLRESTEKLTRKRLTALNLHMVEFFIRQEANAPGFVRRLPTMATDLLQQRGMSKANRWLALWILGLNEKAFQNVLKDDPAALAAYRDSYLRICGEVAQSRADSNRVISGRLQIDNVEVEIDGLFLAYLLNTTGAQTLAIRGSEKSAYGKLFEKLVLGTALTLLGFELTTHPPVQKENVFWFTSADEKRESDATLLFAPGKGVRFDIGFIGRGNSEISLDKVSRFERDSEVSTKSARLHTVIIVDRIGARSRLAELAANINGTVVQMSASYWVRQLAEHLKKFHRGFQHPLVKMNDKEVHQFLEAKTKDIDLDKFVSNWNVTDLATEDI